MTAPQMHRASLLLALFGILLMLTASLVRLAPGDGLTLPNRESVARPDGRVNKYFAPRG